MMNTTRIYATLAFAGLLALATPASAGVSTAEAAKLNSELTPLGAEKAGNKDGSIPKWTGGYTQSIPGYTPGGKIPDPFASDKPLLTITAKNMDQYADKLTEGVKALFKKYPDTYKIHVYQTRRTAAAPQWVYDNTFKNATRAKLNGDIPEGAYGGIPFPIPKSGAEAIWNHQLSWQGVAWHAESTANLVTADGRMVVIGKQKFTEMRPYYDQKGSAEAWRGDTGLISFRFTGPSARVGESLLIRNNADASKTRAWVYFAGQRRTRQLPNPCCDSPNPATGGVIGYDEIYQFYGPLSRYDWKLVGKREVYIPYNNNKFLQAPKDTDLVVGHHINPEWSRWELHRVWEVEATLRSGQRHQAPKAVFYLDEDSWQSVLSERYDAQGNLWKLGEQTVVVGPTGSVVSSLSFNSYDLLAGTLLLASISVSTKDDRTYIDLKLAPDGMFTPEAMATEGIR
jgi:hypothetical protein